jgi:signal transduction histidine kinase
MTLVDDLHDIELLNREAAALRSRQTSQALLLSTQAISLLSPQILGLQPDDPPERYAKLYHQKGLALFTQGECLFRQNKLNDALPSLTESHLIFKTLHLVKEQLQTIQLIGTAYHKLSEYDLSYRIHTEGLVLSEHAEDKGAQGRNLIGMGNARFAQSDFSKALEYYEQSIMFLEQAGDTSSLISALMNLGNVYSTLGDYHKAMSYFQSSLSLNNGQNRHAEGLSFVNLGTMNVSLTNYKEALACYEKALAPFEETGDMQSRAVTLIGIADVLRILGDYPAAIQSLTQAIDILEPLGDLNQVASATSSLGEVSLALHDYQKAAEFFQQSRAMFGSIGNRSGVVEAAIGLAQARLAELRFEESELITLEAIKEAESLGLKNELHQLLLLYSTLFEKKQMFAESLRYYKKAIELKEELFNEKTTVQIQNFQMAVDVERAKSDSEKFRQHNERLMRAQDDLSIALYELQQQKDNLTTANTMLVNAVTELQQQKEIAEDARRRATEASQFKTEMIGIAAHDLKNPLQAVLGFSELINETPDDTSLVSDLSNEIKHTAKHMIRLISDLLDTASLDSGRLNLNRQLQSLNDIAADVLHDARFLAERKQQTIHYDDHAPVIAAEIDPARIRQVFDNVIGNAVKYSPPSSNIYVCIETASLSDLCNAGFSIEIPNNDTSTHVACLRVRDEGQGLSDDDKQKLFQRFQRLSAKPTGGESSSGLGLSIAKKIVELHGGDIVAYSKGKHQGSEFLVVLPLPA